MLLNTGHEYANVDGTASMTANDEARSIYLNMQPISPSGKCKVIWFSLEDIIKYLCVGKCECFAMVWFIVLKLFEINSL